MTRKVSWLGAAAVAASIVVPSAGPSKALAQEKTAAAKALEANPELRTTLDTETFRQLKQNLPKAKVEGKTYFFVEGDLRLDEDQLLFYAVDRANQEQAFKLASIPGLPGSGPTPGELLSHTVNGQVIRWTPGATLTYCVLKRTFADSARYQMAVDNMKAAAGEWAKTCNIKFKHDVAKDDSAPAATPPAGVLFTVREVVPDDPDDAPIASAFFPGDPRADRHLLIFPDYFTPDLLFDKVGVIRHELGHVVGFRHEHIRSEAPPACRGEPLFGAIPQTAYDPKSVMHYFCGNRGTKELKISATDRKGARKVYGAPVIVGAISTTPPEKPLDVEAESFKAAFQDVNP